MKLKLKKGDNVYIRAGKDRGKHGKVIRVLSEEGKLVVEGINLFKHHTRPRKAGEKGSIITKSMPFPAARAMLVCQKCNKPTRVGYKINEKNKFRICKKCQQEI